MRWHPLLRRFSQHEGTDFAAPPFTPVFATEKGIVVEAKYHPVAGNYVVVRHPQGWKSRYLHLNRLNVVAGQEIKQGSIVAYSGNELKGYGNLVLVRHSNGYVTAYAHASELMVKRGETIKRGQIIAKSGQSGEVGSPQLHFEIRKGSSPVDPLQFLNGA